MKSFETLLAELDALLAEFEVPESLLQITDEKIAQDEMILQKLEAVIQAKKFSSPSERERTMQEYRFQVEQLRDLHQEARQERSRATGQERSSR